ncbi:polysaccharide deacetylase family protein [Azohydromonas australica]|uniref:polysaccharide deacetylase family protein n=1 Tax=Azohydromonas australica TaxID=364039 RepID=UPI0004112282|nr:polysaccharide deacetylase family protein [Azohydromonas australica]
MLRRLLGWLSPAGDRGRLSVLVLHRVHLVADPLHPDDLDAMAFNRVCGWLAQLFNVLPLDEAVRRLSAGTLPARALSISFDDGYADCHDVALPILQRHGLCATFFITTGSLDGGCMWNDLVDEAVRLAPSAVLDLRGLGIDALQQCDIGSTQRKHEACERIKRWLKYLPQEQRQVLAQEVVARAGVKPPSDLMMSSEQVRRMYRAGMQIGAHTVSHPILAGLPAEQVRAEVGRSKQHLQSILDAPVELFAYPNGRQGQDFDLQAIHIVREAGFNAAVTTDWGSANRHTDPFLIPRFMPWDRTRLRFGLRMAANLHRHGGKSAAMAGCDSQNMMPTSR